MIYSEGAVEDLLDTLSQLCGSETTIFLAGELRNGKMLSPFPSCFLWLSSLFINVVCVFRFYPGILSRSRNEGLCNWASGADAMASRLSEPPCCDVRFSEEVMTDWFT